jgi:hypothetical protein
MGVIDLTDLTILGDPTIGHADLDPDQRRVNAARDHQVRRAAEVVQLLNAREDLRGVHALADLVGESVLWSA